MGLSIYGVSSLLADGCRAADIFSRKSVIQHKDTGKVAVFRHQSGAAEMIGDSYRRLVSSDLCRQEAAVKDIRRLNDVGAQEVFLKVSFQYSKHVRI